MGSPENLVRLTKALINFVPIRGLFPIKERTRVIVRVRQGLYDTLCLYSVCVCV